MPLYEYQCDACGHQFEIIQKFSDPPVEKCPQCEGRVTKLISSPAIQFKGTGWYVTDYAKKRNDGSAGGDDQKPAGKDKSSPAASTSATGSSASPAASSSKDS